MRFPAALTRLFFTTIKTGYGYAGFAGHSGYKPLAVADWQDMSQVTNEKFRQFRKLWQIKKPR